MFSINKSLHSIFSVPRIYMPRAQGLGDLQVLRDSMVLDFAKKTTFKENPLCCVLQQNTNFEKMAFFSLRHHRDRLKNWACWILDLTWRGRDSRLRKRRSPECQFGAGGRRA